MRAFHSLAIFGAALAAAHPSLETRSTQSLGQFYAYGTNISGLPIFYNNGVAYAGNTSLLADNTTATYVNFTLASGVITATALSSNVSLSNAHLYVDTTSGAAADAEISSSADSGYSDSDFLVFGTLLVRDADETLASNWFLTTTEVDDIYTLGWSEAGDVFASDTQTSVVVKNLAPVST